MSWNNNKSEFALTEVLIVAAIIALIAVFTIPAFKKVRIRAQEQAIKRNLALIVDTGQLCILENGLNEAVSLKDFEGTYCPPLRSIAGESYADLLVRPKGGKLTVTIGSRIIDYSY